ncbi:glycosyl hydrolase family 32 [Actinotalea sp. K2]|uniref:glycosyl hydrolase family 32 n=1 Tax=Actinotalea sp. K2 TaxID=2939438 RepID=UPI002017F528|nr:glycosyl hydrolase family 32 [Actinotalea sp. K2]MCL3861051.1 glycosyl hydrolase family 32 [Actinotalea sp. K2]
MLRFDDAWVWDSWSVDDGDLFHLFYLQAPRTPEDQRLRHFSVSVGHAVSRDLTEWRVLPDALCPAPAQRWDDMSTWTGSVVRAPDGTWLMFYTGVSHRDLGLVQRIGVASSPDLVTWHRLDEPVIEADARWYERLEQAAWPDEAWRDPFVTADPDGDGWHMFLTARATLGRPDRRGVIGHARSRDLRTWEVQPPLTEPESFGHLEVPQVVRINGTYVLIFSCDVSEIPADLRRAGHAGGVWSTTGASITGPFDIDKAELFPHESLYAARLVQDRAGQWNLLGFRNFEGSRFIGEIADPILVTLDAGRLVPLVF